MAYGLNLYFPGYPTIDLSGMVPYAPLGMVCDTHANTTSGSTPDLRSKSFTYAIPAPSGASVYASASVRSFNQSVQGAPKQIWTMSASNSSGSFSWRPARPTSGSPTLYSVANMVVNGGYGSLNTGGTYGLYVQNNGIQSILNGNPTPMIVKGKYEYSVSAGTYYRDFNLSALDNVNFGVSQKIAVYIGCKNNEVACYAYIKPRGGATTSWSGGGTLRVYFFNPSAGHATYTTRNASTHQSQKATTLYIIVAGANNVTPSGYGLALYNSHGAMTMAPNAVPVLPRGVAWTKSTQLSKPTANPSMLGSADSLPSGMSSSDTFLFQVGANTFSHLGWVYPFDSFASNIYLGDTVMWVYGSQVRTKLWYDYNVGFTGPGNQGWSNYVSASYANSVRRPVLIVRGEDYFTSL